MPASGLEMRIMSRGITRCPRQLANSTPRMHFLICLAAKSSSQPGKRVELQPTLRYRLQQQPKLPVGRVITRTRLFLSQVVACENSDPTHRRDGIENRLLPLPALKSPVLHVRETDIVNGPIRSKPGIDASLKFRRAPKRRPGAGDLEAFCRRCPGLSRRGMKRCSKACCRKPCRPVLGNPAVDLVFKPVVQPMTRQIRRKFRVGPRMKPDLVALGLQRMQSRDLVGRRHVKSGDAKSGPGARCPKYRLCGHPVRHVEIIKGQTDSRRDLSGGFVGHKSQHDYQPISMCTGRRNGLFKGGLNRAEHSIERVTWLTGPGRAIVTMTFPND